MDSIRNSEAVLNKDFIKAKLDEIRDVIMDIDYVGTVSDNNQGVFEMHGGLVLFLYNYYYHSKDISYKKKAEKILVYLFEFYNSNATKKLSYCDGIAGIYALLYHLVHTNYLDKETIDNNCDLDCIILEKSISDINHHNYDNLYGAGGYIIYFFMKYRATRQTHVKEYLYKIVCAIYDHAKKDPLFCMSNREANRINLGLAHGISGLIVILCTIRKEIDSKQKLDTVIKILTGYLLKVNIDFSKISIFPNSYYLSFPETSSEASRLAWCYGDLGCAFSLYKASLALQDDQLTNLSIQLLMHTVKRRSYDNTFLVDAGLCHGVAGLGMFYSHLYSCTHLVEFKEASIYWSNQILEYAKYDFGDAGFVAVTSVNGQTIYKKDRSLIYGVPGIGLAMLDALCPECNAWKEFFLLN